MNAHEKYLNKCRVLKTFVDERDSESSILVKCGDCKPILLFDSCDARDEIGAPPL